MPFDLPMKRLTVVWSTAYVPSLLYLPEVDSKQHVRHWIYTKIYLQSHINNINDFLCLFLIFFPLNFMISI